MDIGDGSGSGPTDITKHVGGLPPADVTPLRPEAMRESVRQGHVKLVSDGKSAGGTFLLMPDGQPIPGIKRIEWICEAGGRPELNVSFGTAEVEIGDGG